MHTNIYSPFHILPHEVDDRDQLSGEALESIVVSDDELREYIKAYFESYHKTVDEFFPQLSHVLTLYAKGPFHSTVVRMGPVGIFFGHRQSSDTRIDVVDVKEVLPGAKSINVFDIAKQLEFEHCWFDFTPTRHDADEGAALAVRNALSAVLEFFWKSIPNAAVFETLCLRLIEAEGPELDQTSSDADMPSKAMATVVLNEPGGFRRVETWEFSFKHYPHERVSAESLHELEASIEEEAHPNVICLVTPDDLTSVSKYIASNNPRIRIWDRAVLNRLVNLHLDILREYFAQYPAAVEELSRRLSQPDEIASETQTSSFEQRLRRCPPGQSHFAEYERIGIDALTHLFGEHLGDAHPQERTIDDKQRRDVIFRNNRSLRFLDRLFHRFSTDFVIVDFKNYKEPVQADVVTDVDKYANKALGRFVLVVSRKGKADSVASAQMRVYRDSDTVVLVISDDDLLEMCQRKDRGQQPEDVLEDKLDDLLRKY